MSPAFRTVLAVLALGAAGTAAAQDTGANHINGVRPDIHIDFGGYGSVGAGFRVDIPVVPGGFLDNADDEFAISVGSEVFFYDVYPGYYDGGLYLIPVVVAQWNFYVHPKWSLFPEAGLAMYVGPNNHLRRGGGGYYLAPAFSLGARYHFTGRNSLLLRASTPSGFQVGITF